MLTKDQLRTRGLNIHRRYREVCLLDGSVVRLQSLTRAEQREWRNALKNKDGSVNQRKVEFSNDLLLAMCIVDQDGSRVFTDGDAISGMFDTWDTEDTTVLVDAAVEHCGLILTAKETESLLKNSEATRGNDSSGERVSGSA